MKNKILLIDIAYPVSNRMKKIGDLFDDSQFEKINVLWNRDHSNVHSDHLSSYVLNSNFGYGKVSDLFFHLPFFFLFLRKVIRKEKPDVLLCRYWIPAFLCCFFLNDKMKLIYDINDLPYGSPLIVKLSRFFEKLPLKKSSLILLSSRFQKALYSKYEKKCFTLENKVSASLLNEGEFEQANTKNILFVGQVRYKEILFHLFEAFRDKEYSILLYGKGSDSKDVQEYIVKKQCTNVALFGRYDYKDISKYYAQGVFVWAAYPSNDFNVKIAISNKFFECLHFEKIMIVSKQTCLGDLVEKEGIGLVVDCYDQQDIYEKISTCQVDVLLKRVREYKMNHPLFWEDSREELNKRMLCEVIGR